jgi:hypothetical protein
VTGWVRDGNTLADLAQEIGTAAGLVLTASQVVAALRHMAGAAAETRIAAAALA